MEESKTKKSLQEIKKYLTHTGRNVESIVQNIVKHLDSQKGSSQVNTLYSGIQSIAGAVSSLGYTSDSVKIVSATLDVISAVTTFMQIKSPVTSTLFSLIEPIFGAIAVGWDATEDIGNFVQREIEKTLHKYDDSQLRAEASGTMRAYAISHAYLAAREGDSPIEEHEIAALPANVSIYQGISFLGMLAQKVKENSKSSNPDQVKQAMEYLQLYITLAVLRSSILWQMYAIAKSSQRSDFTTAAIYRIILADDKHDKNFLSFLQKPDYQQAVFFAYFNPSEWPTTMTFMEKKNITYQYQQHDHLAHNILSLKLEKIPRKFMVMGDGVNGNMHVRETNDARSRFYFDPISKENNVFRLRSEKWPSWYMYMTDDKDGFCRGYGGMKGPVGEWKLTRFKDGKYMLSPHKWLNWFIYMDDDYYGHIRGYKGDPGIQGHWVIA